MGFLESIRLAFRQIFVWRGRACWSEFWWATLFMLICAFAIGFLLDWGSGDESLSFLAGYVFFSLATVSLRIRRLHDRNHAAWMLFVPIVLVILMMVALPFSRDDFSLHMLVSGVVTLWNVYLLAQLLLPGDPGENRFGPPASRSLRPWGG